MYVWYGMVWYGMYVCMHVCMYVCIYVCMYVCMHRYARIRFYHELCMYTVYIYIYNQFGHWLAFSIGLLARRFTDFEDVLEVKATPENLYEAAWFRSGGSMDWTPQVLLGISIGPL